MFPQSWFLAAFTAWGSPVTWLEIIAFVLSLWMIACEMRVSHWTWPLAIVSSAIYGVLFAQYKLFGEASLQLFFIAISIWGWWLWLFPRADAPPSAAPVRRMTHQQYFRYGAAAITGVVSCGLFLSHFTSSDVPWWDAVPTGLSVVAQVMLARKFVENWLAWIVVNVLSTALFAYKGLYLTSLLYSIFAVLSVIGWRAWRLLLIR
jgi:nicotinamide mononucleotide transporter